MNFEFSKTSNPISTVILSLNTLYRVHADSSYNVENNLTRDNKELIALRTLKGSGIVKIDGYADKRVTEGTLLFFEYNKVKSYFCENDHWNFCWFNFNINGCYYFPMNITMHIEQMKNEEYECEICMNLLRMGKSYSNALASSKFSSLIYDWMYHFQLEKQKTTPHHEAINNVIQYLYANINKNVTVSHMTKIAGFSERRFREVFKDHTGKPPKQYYETLKMNLASELLHNTSLSIADISEKLGYLNQFYFCRVFVKFYNMTPSSYRYNPKP